MPLGIDTKQAVKVPAMTRKYQAARRALMLRTVRRGAEILGLPPPSWGEIDVPLQATKGARLARTFKFKD